MVKQNQNETIKSAVKKEPEPILASKKVEASSVVKSNVKSVPSEAQNKTSIV